MRSGRGSDGKGRRPDGGSGAGTITTESAIIQSSPRVTAFERQRCASLPRLAWSEAESSSPFVRGASSRTVRKKGRRRAMDGRSFENNEENSLHAERSFGSIDCAVFGAMLTVSALVGVYQAYVSRKKPDAVGEYLVGGRNMSVFPVSMSLIASYVSGITILGLPAEMYVYGTQYWTIVIADAFVSLTIALIYLPVFYGLGITSSYEYLRLRFNNTVRLAGCIMFLVKMLLYVPLVIYVPALAFNQVTGLDLHATALVVCAVCIFYTTLGGLKAVVWTDTIQTILMFGGVIIVAFLGTSRAGGLAEVWKKNLETGRIEFFDMNPDPTVRHTFWTVVFGNYLNWLASCSVNQAMVQRCLAVPNLERANALTVIMGIGIVSIVSLSCYTGIVIFAAFHDCDPVTTKQIGKPDQLLPFFVMEMASTIPGLSGLFVSGVFSAALSTMSTGLNSMAGVIYEDMIRPCLATPLSQTAAGRLVKAIVVLTGFACMGLVFLVERLGALVQAAKSLSSITAGPLLGIFTLGMLFPSANSLGALVGGLVGLNLVGWISFGTQAAISRGEIRYPIKPVSVEGCSESLRANLANFTSNIETAIRKEPFFLYRISYLWYTWIGFLTAIFLGLLVSWITGPDQYRPENEKLYAPFLRPFLRSDPITNVTELEKMGPESTSDRTNLARLHDPTGNHCTSSDGPSMFAQCSVDTTQ